MIKTSGVKNLNGILCCTIHSSVNLDRLSELSTLEFCHPQDGMG